VASSFPLHVKARKATQTLGKIVEANVKAIDRSGVLSSVMQHIWPNDSALRSYGIHMIKRLLKTDMPPDQLVWGHILGTAGGMVSNQGQLFGQTIEYFLVGDGKKHWPAIQALAQEDTEENFEKLMHYFLEGSRLNGETGVFRRAAKDTSVTDGDHTFNVKAGEQVFVNLRSASHDAEVFGPNPDEIDLNRPLDAYVHLGHGPHQCLGLPMTRISLTTMLREVAKLPGLRPAKGPQGKVHKVAKNMLGKEYPYHAYLTENWDGYWPFPCGESMPRIAFIGHYADIVIALKVNWDDE
jgi:hypothetical protein